DPNTNDYYQEGFLPPNTNPPQGEGAVRFRIRPRSDAESGTVIANRASIIFDPHLGANPPIVTNTHTLTLDKQAPVIALETPSSTTLPTTKATLRWNATDDASGVAEVEIWAQEGSNARRIGQTNAAGERTESGTVVVRARRFGDETRIITRGRDRVGNTQPFSDTPQLTLRFGQPPQFSAGLHLIGIPVQLDNPDVQSLFGFQNNQWATYNPATGQYVQHPDSATAAQIGRGYWVLLPNAVQPNIVGNLPDPEQSYTVALQPGWNLIANPWTEPLVWNRAATQVRVNGVLYALDSSSAQQFVEPYLWGWEPNPSNPQQGRYRLVYDAQLLNGIDNQLQPWRGYWIYAHQPCELILPTPEVAATTPSRSVPREGRGGWSLRIGAHLGDQYDEVMLGVSGTEQGLQVAMPPAPPSRSAVSGVQLRLIRDGAPMEAELLPRTRLQRQWTLELSVPPSDEPRTRTVLLTTPDIAQLPRGVNPVLRDLETGERRFLRGSAGWQIAVPAEGLTRRYEITLVPTSRLLRIMNLQVSGGRSNGGQFTVQYVLSDAARVTAIVEHNGKPLRTLEQGRSRSIGAHQLVWDGRDQQGRALPPGAYTLMLMAETEDGQIARATAPIVITR
ncbi:MAG: FlgD immunoglobulin-like domain containing protein, partial [Armatimonadota bacterium]|nr:FlgD immunoglobulin-like domain containing protein [Armatimonadota bacterium]